MPDTTCALMAARLKQIARDQKKVTANAARRVLRQAVSDATKDYARAGTLGRKLWSGWKPGKRQSSRQLEAEARSRVLKGLGLSERPSGFRWRSGGFNEGRKAEIPLIVKLTKTRWQGDVWRGGIQSRGVAAHIEQGLPFKPHRMGRGTHPGGAVHQHRSIEPALKSKQSELSRNVREDVQRFLAEALK